MTDQELLERFSAARDQEAFAELVGRHVQFVYGVARRQVPAEAEDITQAVFLLLSQKPRRAAKAHSLAGWLFWVTRNCCLNARRLRSRRSLHEREAGRMVHETLNVTLDAEQQESLVRQLDEAIAQLPRRYQEAVFLRYLQGKSLAETGAVLGVSAAAAGKIAGRALERLRVRFAKSGLHIPTGAVGAVLAEEGAKAVPANLSTTIVHGVSSSGGAVLASKASLLAHGTGRALAAGYWRIAAVIAASIILAGATGLAIHQFSIPARAAMPVILRAAPPADPVDESKVEGEVCIVTADFLLDAEGAATIKSLTEAMPADAAFFEFRQGDSEALRHALKDMQSNGQLVSVNHLSQMNLNMSADDPTAGGYSEAFAKQDQNNVYAGVARNGHAVSVGSSMRDGPTILEHGTMLFHSDGSKASVKIDVKDGTAILQQAPLDNNGQPLPPRAGQVAGTERLEKPFHVQWDGPITPGRAVVLIGDFGPWKDDHLVNVRFIAAYKASATEIRFAHCLNGDPWNDLRWLYGGPQGLRDAVDPAIVWAAGGEDPPAMPPAASPWMKHLSDGSTVELMSLAQERDMPLQRWSPDGQPRAVIDRTWAINSIPTFATDQRYPLPFAAMVRIHSAKPVPNNGQQNGRVEPRGELVPQGLDHLSLWVGAGDWKVQPIAEHQSVSAGNVTINLNRIVTRAPDRVSLMTDSALQPEMEIHLGLITKDHKQLMAVNNTGIWNSVWAGDFTHGGGAITVPLEQIDHYVVFSRPREQVVFEGFKSAPLAELPEKVTPEQVRAAEARIAQRDYDLGWEDFAIEWAEYQAFMERVKAVPRDPATPAGAMCLLLDKVAAGDVEGIRACLTGDDGQRTGCAHMALARAKALRAVMDKFGEQKVYRAIFEAWNWGLPHHVKSLVDPEAWTIKDDTATTQDRRMIVLRGGRWCFPIYGKAGGTEFDKGVEACDAFVRDLGAGKFKDASEAVKALNRIAPYNDEIASLP